MIIVKISGGLGNQLFQYAFGRCMSIKLGVKLKYDVQTENLSSKFTQRVFSLSHLIEQSEIATNEDIANFKISNNKFLQRLERWLVNQFPYLNRKFFIQDLYRGVDFNLVQRDNCYYDGYWQSERYFKPVEPLIRQHLKSLHELDSYSISLLAEIENSESVSLHIRRGDYISDKNNKSMFGQCTLEYYKHGIQRIVSQVKNPIFYVFSDDLKWVRENFVEEYFHIVDNSSQPINDMYLMSRCKHNIIANSSFSWWAAWLNENPAKTVIAPEIWYINKMYDKDIIPDGWLRINNGF